MIVGILPLFQWVDPSELFDLEHLYRLVGFQLCSQHMMLPCHRSYRTPFLSILNSSKKQKKLVELGNICMRSFTKLLHPALSMVLNELRLVALIIL